MKHRVAAVVVMFNPDQEVLYRVDELALQVDLVYLIDNSIKYTKWSLNNKNIIIIYNHNRGGLAGALNIALLRSKKEQFDYLFVFDQDTVIDQFFCNNMINAVRLLNNTTYGIYGPRHININTNHPVRISAHSGFLQSVWPSGHEEPIECNFLINSCSLLRLDIIPDGLCYDEFLEVDMIDVDFGFKARSIGIKSICFPNIHVMHGIGNRSIGSMRFSPTNYLAKRKYLQTRNRLIVWYKYYSMLPNYVFIDINLFFIDCFRILLFEESKKNKIHEIIKGLFDGFKIVVMKKNNKVDKNILFSNDK